MPLAERPRRVRPRLALTRELVTQGVAISLPQSVVTDLNSLTSLSAALRLGLREVMGLSLIHI